MRHYTTASTVIMDMHERGFTHDFQLFGNDLLWVQEKVFLKMGEFAILEFHRLWNPALKNADLGLYGILATYHNIRGILINNRTLASGTSAPILIKKMNELQQRNLYREDIENRNT